MRISFYNPPTMGTGTPPSTQTYTPLTVGNDFGIALTPAHTPPYENASRAVFFIRREHSLGGVARANPNDV
jgi:hypothetical protein